MDSTNQHRPFVRLPVELLEDIYILSETHALLHACQRFYICLSSRSTRLRFCTRLFYIDNPRKDPDQRGLCLRDKQTKILAQEWFTLDFAISLKAAVKHIHASDRFGDNTGFFLFFRGIHMPARLLCEPWGQSKFDLLGQLYICGLRINPLDKLKCYESMKGAIAENNWEALKILLMIGPDLDLKVFKDLILSGRGSIVRKLFGWVRNSSPVCWGDGEVLEWVRNHGKEELKKLGTY